MIETVNGAFSFKDGKQRMSIDTEKLYNLLKVEDDKTKPYGICGKKYMDKVEGNMCVGLSNNKKKKTGNMKKTVILRFRFSYIKELAELETGFKLTDDCKVDETGLNMLIQRYVTVTVFQHDAIGFAGCNDYTDEPMAIRDQIKSALADVADKVFTPAELFKRKPSISIYNSTFEVPSKVFIINQLKEFLDEKNYEIISSAEITQRGLHITFNEGGALVILISGNNKAFGIRSSETRKEILEFVSTMYADYDNYILENEHTP